MPVSAKDIRPYFEELASPANAVPMAAYMKNRFAFFGIKTPERRALQKEIMAHYKGLSLPALDGALRALFAEAERELHYLAVDWLYSRRKEFRTETLPLIEHLITTNSWWDSVDALATRSLGQWCALQPDRGRSLIRRYIHSGNLWLRRSAIIHQLHYGKDTDTALLTAAILPHLSSREFFLQKAIGWALRQYARHNPDWVREFAESHPLPALSRREALKHL